MRLLNARLVEVCQHEDLQVEFPAGLTLIVGPNGAGKSNLVNLIRSSLTNDFSPMGGVKSDNIRRLKPEGVPSYVESTWLTPGGVMTVRRGLASCRSTLAVDGEEICSGKEDDITKEVLTRINLSSAKINDFLFADQDKLQDVIGGAKSRRAELFQSLCGIEMMQTLDRLLRDTVSADKAVIANFDQEELDSSLLSWSALTGDIRRIAGAVADMEAAKLPADKLNEYRQIIADVNRILELKEDLARIKDRLRKSKAVAEELFDLVGEKAAALETAEKAFDALDVDSRSLDVRLNNATQENAAAKAFRAAKDVLANVRPGRPDFVERDEQKLQAELFRLESAVERLSQLISVADSEGVTECETCGSPIESVREHAEVHREELAALSPKLAKLKDVVKQYRLQKRQYEQFVVADKEWVSSRDNALKVVATTKEMYPAKPPAAVDVVGLREEKQTVDRERAKAAERLKQAKADYQHTQNQLNGVESRVVSEEQQIAAIVAKLQATSTNAFNGNVSSLQHVIAQQQSLLDNLNMQKSDLAVKRSQAATASKNIRRLRRERRRLARTSTWVDCAERGRAILKKDRLPARLVAGMLGRTTSIVNDYLERLGVTYRVEAEVRDFAFEALHVDGTREPASRLSVGQKTCLAIAFWLARAEVFVGSLPFFCLDEPTAHLDTSRVAHVADLFSLLAAQLHSEERQGIVITHHGELARVATHTIVLN